MAVAATRLFLALFLLSILIATVNLTDGGKTDEQTVTGGVENLSVKWVDNKKEGKMDVTLEMGKPVTSKHEKPVPTPVNDVKQEEMTAVGDNISAVYIVRVIKERAANLEYSMLRAKEKIHYAHVDKLEKVMEKVTTLVQKLATTQQKANKLADQVAKKVDVMMNEMLLKITKEEVLKLERQLSEARESGGKEEQKKIELHHNMWLAMLEKSNLTTIDMEMLKGDLAGVFKTDKHKKKYVKSVDRLIAKFRKKVKKFVEGKKTWGTYAEEQEGEEEDQRYGNTQAYAVHVLYEICVEQLDFLEQIRLELELHYIDFNTELKAFRANTTKLVNLKVKNKWIVLRDNKNIVDDALLDRSNTDERIIDSLMRLNDIGQNLFMKFHNEQKHEQQHVYVTSILEVAKKAAVEDKFHNKTANIKGYWTSLLEELIQIFYQAGKVLAELSPDLKKIYTKIHEKIEMPKGLLLEKETEAKAHSPTNHKREYDEFTEAIVNMSAPIDVLLAKQLLVYDRLNRFYMLDQYLKICIEKQQPNGNTSYMLLDSLCQKFNV